MKISLKDLSIYGAMSIADKIIDVYNKDKIDRVELFFTDVYRRSIRKPKECP